MELVPLSIAPINPGAAITAAAPFADLAPVRGAAALLLDLALLHAALFAQATIHARSAIGITPAVGGIRALRRGLCHAQQI